jgi:hypothetical protein
LQRTLHAHQFGNLRKAPSRADREAAQYARELSNLDVRAKGWERS